MDPNPNQLAAFLHNNYPEGIFKCAYEAGFCGFWVQHELSALNLECIVVNPADIPTSHKEKQQKSDPRDSRKLSREFENNNLESIYIFTHKDHTLKSLCRTKKDLTKELARIKCKIRMYMHLHGKPIPEETAWCGAFISKLERTAERLENGEALILYLDSLKFAKGQVLKATKALRKALIRADRSDLLKRLRTIPGIGFMTAATFITEIVDIKRFKNFNCFACYVGLVPWIESSDEREKVKGLSRRKNKFLMNMIVESAWIAVKKGSCTA